MKPSTGIMLSAYLAAMRAFIDWWRRITYTPHCLVCGRELPDDKRDLCSPECETEWAYDTQW